MREIINRYINQILVHSYLYSINEAIITDYEWDLRAKKLVKLIEENKEIAQTLPYYEQFIDWGGDTSMNFVYDDTIIRRAQMAYWAETGKKLKLDELS